MTRKNIFADISDIAHGALNIADALQDDIKRLVQKTCNHWLNDKSLLTKEEAHELRNMLSTVQKKQQQIEEKLATLEKRLRTKK